MTKPHISTDLSRRDFLKAAGGSAACALTAQAQAPPRPPLLPQRELGRTGVKVPILGLGTAPVGQLAEKEAVAFYHRCIDSGVTYLDTAPEFAGYAKAQVYLGQVLKERRQEVFVVTKCMEPDGNKALRLLEQNLKELQIKQADLVFAHHIGSDKMEPATIFGAGGVCRALAKAKRDGLTRFVGVSAHNRPGRCLQALQDWDFDVMMNAVSLVARHIYNFEERVWPQAAKKGVGLAAMKVFGGFLGGKAAKGARLPESFRQASLRYALGLPVSVVVLGMFNDQELKQNLAWARQYLPLAAAELAALDKPTRELADKWGQVYGPVA